MGLDEEEEYIEKEETETHREFQNMLQYKTLHGDKSYRIEEGTP